MRAAPPDVARLVRVLQDRDALVRRLVLGLALARPKLLRVRSAGGAGPLRAAGSELPDRLPTA